MTEHKLSKADLRQFTGSEHWYRHSLVQSILYTDGAQYVAEHGGAYWLIDEIAFAQKAQKAVKAEEFQVWKLQVDLDKHKGVLLCEDGNNNVVFTKQIEYTDFPLDEISLWCVNNTIFLPSEY